MPDKANCKRCGRQSNYAATNPRGFCVGCGYLPNWKPPQLTLTFKEKKQTRTKMRRSVFTK